jgi:superfamily II DNA/RNA helicase
LRVFVFTRPKSVKTKICRKRKIMESFQELGLPEFLGKSLKQMNFTQPTPVQAKAIPVALEGKDVIASAQTGTGKTAAFGIPLLTYLSKNPDKTALVLTPTRELAAQVLEMLRKLSGTASLGGSVLLIGGANMGGQINSLMRKPRMIIGTPGRVIDHLNRGSLKLSASGFLVLDEADRMLDMGFEPQLEEIRKRLPAERQTLLFSATFPPDIQAMGSRYLKSPVRITIGDMGQPVEKINQMVIHTTEAKKFEEMTGELNERQGSAVIFARTQNRVERLLEKLKAAGFKATQVHGGRTQSQRRQAIEQFRLGSYRLLVATDVAARGLDIHHIAHVINYDLPRNPEDYIHRVGRTARAGAQGDSLALLTPEDRSLWEAILRLIKVPKDSIQIKKSRFGDFTPAPRPYSPHAGAPQASDRQGFGGRRPHASKGRPQGRERGDRAPRRDHAPKGDFTPRGERSFNRDFAPKREFAPKKEFTPRGDAQPSSFQRPEGGRPPKQRRPDGRHQVRSDRHHGRGPDAGFSKGPAPFKKDFENQPQMEAGNEVDGNRVDFKPRPSFSKDQNRGRGFQRPGGKPFGAGARHERQEFRGPRREGRPGFSAGPRPFGTSGGDRPFRGAGRPFSGARPEGRPGNFSKGPRRNGNDHQGQPRPGGPRPERDGNRGGFQNRHLQEPASDDIGNR